ANFVLSTLGHASNGQESIRWRQSWKAVMNSLREQLSVEQKEEAHQIWMEFIHARYPNVPIIRKPRAWPAALEYLIVPTTLKEVDFQYDVSTQTVKKNVETIRNR